MSPSQSSSNPFELHPYSIDKLVELLADRADTSRERVALKYHKTYFEHYFDYPTINAQTIIVENHYIDRDYLQDYTDYYVSCFFPYRKTTSRFHFFGAEISEDEFGRLLESQEPDILEKASSSYLGFIVVKPLPETIIGRTCLKVYDSDSERRHYTAIKTTEVNLFGIPLRIRSLPFQEQDKSVAACATSALWSVFQSTGKLFQHAIPSPAYITKIASSHTPQDDRYFPNRGLTPFQMAAAVRAVGLEPYKIQASDPVIFKSALYAYLKFQLPIILGIALVDFSDPAKPKWLGRHAVAVTGFSLPQSILLPNTDLKLKAFRIDKIYVHDDQIGPFSKMTIDNSLATFDNEQYFSLTTGWPSDDGSMNKVKALPEFFLIPLYHKIRIPFQVVLSVISGVGDLLEQLNASNNLGLYFEWDIYLTTVNDFKKECFQRSSFPPELKKATLLKTMSKYLWCARLNNENGDLLLEYVFDATDIEQGPLFLHRNDLSDDLKQLLHIFANHPLLQKTSRIILDQYVQI